MKVPPKYQATNSQNVDPMLNGPQLDFGLSGYSKPINTKGMAMGQGQVLKQNR